MKLFKVIEHKNGDDGWCKGIYLTKKSANEEGTKQYGKSSHYESGKGWVEDIYTYDIIPFETTTEPSFDVWKYGIGSNKGKRFHYDCYEDAVKSYQHFVQLHEYVALQLPMDQFDGIGVTEVMNNLDDAYWKEENAYWEAREAEETWRPGDAPWDAPGMCMADFF